MSADRRKLPAFALQQYAFLGFDVELCERAFAADGLYRQGDCKGCGATLWGLTPAPRKRCERCDPIDGGAGA